MRAMLCGQRPHVRNHLLQRTALALLVAIAGNAHAQLPPPATVTQADDSVVFSGRIDATAVAKFLELLKDPAITRLVITSGGGLVSPALDMAFAVHERQLDVEVPSVCVSSCANYIFPAGRHKTLARLGAVAWHGNMAHVLYLQRTGQASWSHKEVEDARQLATREAEFFSRISVDGFVCWFAKIDPYNLEDFYYLSVEDMERFGIGSVTVREQSAPRQEKEGARLVRVDWKTLEADRPAVSFSAPLSR
jgi:hypothetical protein